MELKPKLEGVLSGRKVSFKSGFFPRNGHYLSQAFAKSMNDFSRATAAGQARIWVFSLIRTETRLPAFTHGPRLQFLVAQLGEVG